MCSDQPKKPSRTGRAKIVEVARRFGIKAPLPDTPSLPIGADEVTVLEHGVAYATFPNKGKSVTPHAVLEVRTGAGDLVWRFDRDGKKPMQAIPASVASDMAGMMSHVVSEGTARRAALDGIPTAGKTGTTNAYRDAWFVGYTGNFTCAVWYGNDDYSPTNRMTGGSLPAQTWHDIMVAAHQGVEIKEIPGIGMGTKLPVPVASAAMAANGAIKPPDIKPGPPPILTKRGADILVRVEKMLDEAAKAAGKTSSSIFSTRTRISAPRLVRIGGGPGLMSGGLMAPLAAIAAEATGTGSFVPIPIPGISLISTPWWAATMMSCQVCAGSEPPVMRLVGE